jgi:hypothetical protein
VLLSWSKVSGATQYQIKVQKTSQSSAAGYVFTLPSSRSTFRLKKSNFPDYRKVGGYLFGLCAVNATGRNCVSVGAMPATTGPRVSTANRQAAANKVNSCLANATDAFVVGGTVALVSLVVPGAGALTAIGVVALAAAGGGATYVLCALRSPGDSFVTDDSSYLSSSTGGFGGGGGGGAGGGGSWRAADWVTL